MFARCPHCGTVFAVTPEQLKLARGRVRCGNCFTPFNGLRHLVRSRPGEDPDGAQGPGAPLIEVPIAKDSAAQPPAVSDAGEVPELLAADLAREVPARPWVRDLQVVMILVLLALGLVQYAWFMPRDFLARFPDLRPLAGPVLERLGRTSSRVLDPSRVHLVSRQVRAHASYAGAITLDAVLVSEPDYPQDLPELRLSLFDVNGRIIAARNFSPHEYLAGAALGLRRMAPGTPVPVHLELASPESEAVNYEIELF